MDEPFSQSELDAIRAELETEQAAIRGRRQILYDESPEVRKFAELDAELMVLRSQMTEEEWDRLMWEYRLGTD